MHIIRLSHYLQITTIRLIAYSILRKKIHSFLIQNAAGNVGYFYGEELRDYYYFIVIPIPVE